MTKKITDFFALESNYPDLDAEGAVARLSQAIQCRTINYADHSLTDYSEFDKLHAHMKASYPHIMRAGVFERLGHHAVLITIPGSDETLRPCLYMSHQDVVPVVEGTEQDWTHPAFSGAVADSYIWGRGTLDIKEQVFGVLEAAEYLLARGRTFRRTAYLAFGDDEETLNTGALAISDHLKAQGVTLEFVLDEGGGKIESGAAFGAPDISIAQVDLMEKGYADLELTVHSVGGHSSRPYGGTSLAHLACAISDIVRSPFPVRLNPAMMGAFETLAPYITVEPLKTLTRDVRANADAIAAYCYQSPALFPFCHHDHRSHRHSGQQQGLQRDAAGYAGGHQPPSCRRRHGRERDGALPRGGAGPDRGTALPAGQRSLRHGPARWLRLPHGGGQYAALLPRRGVRSVHDRRRD